MSLGRHATPSVPHCGKARAGSPTSELSTASLTTCLQHRNCGAHPVLLFVCGVHLRSSVVSFPSVFRRRKFRLRLPSRTLVLGERTLVMGVLNVTPDSFSDGGAFLASQAAVALAVW